MLMSLAVSLGKNFRRRSVEGLSMLLFGAAFHGNLFYVLSILLSPYAIEEEGRHAAFWADL
jgi:lipopolysaccharide export LptBFGC system permease protein LptF